ncbi:glutaminyl-peptide cyclotransferase [Pedobacter cryoconitis]|uniref:Glutaminyl-peptide cyclotransferase n=1 Tax=Pedobacter cryoconitis TaxID=188932 RepID=A0A7W8ZQY4_9SPHI|nr:glutaminyl-peptide cyclotransferase [Pedobacter cryoconitis]MBB5638547.1 glutaminyl-peptide cyclotransferase [Pedobacter cryoconitis]
MYKKYIVLALGLAIVVASCQNKKKETQTVAASADSTQTPKNLTYKVAGTLPHDTAAYTEGFELYGAKIYEGTGTYENSFISIADTATGKVEKRFPLKDKSIYGEGISILNNQLFQLTYQNHIAYVYDVKDLNKVVGTFKWPYEGWGMTNDGKNLYVSVGSSIIYKLDPKSFAVAGQIQVTDDLGTVDQLNELEYADGFIYVNKWQTTKILKVDPASGKVVGTIDCFGLLSNYAPDYTPKSDDSVLNGIAWDKKHQLLYVTGKNWPLIFKLKLD